MRVGRRLLNHRNTAYGAGHPRRGIAAIWVLLTVPMLVTAFVVMFNAGNLWLASYEAQKAFEAGALAAVQQWGKNTNTTPNRLTARNRGVAVAQANTVLGTAVVIPDNNDGNNDVNDNDTPNGFVVLGVLRPVVGGYQFDSTEAPGYSAEDLQDKGGDFGTVTEVTVTLQDGTILNGTLSTDNANASSIDFTGSDADGDDYKIKVQVFTNTDTHNTDDTFRIDNQNPGGMENPSPIVSIVFDLSSDANGHFDLDDGSPDQVNGTNGGSGPALGTGGGETSAQLQGAGEVVFSASTGSPNTLTITITTNDFVKQRQLYFGADTDQVGPGGSNEDFGVRIRGVITVPNSSLLNGLGGSSFGSKNVTGDVFARFNFDGTGQPDIVNVVSILP